MEFLDTVILDNSIKAILIVTGVILFMLLLQKIISKYIATIACNLFMKKWKPAELEQFNKLIVIPFGTFLVVLVSIMAIDKLVFPSAWEFSVYRISFRVVVERIGICIIIIAFIRFAVKLVDFIAVVFEHRKGSTRNKNDAQLVMFFRDFLKALMVIFGILLVIRSGFNQDIGTLLTGLSIVGAALALAAKESIENIIASFIIFFDKPFYVGDTLKVNTITGKVERIGLRSTRIRTPEKTLVTVPNKQMVDGIVDNFSMRSQRRAFVKLELALKTKAELVQAFINEVTALLKEKDADILNSSVYLTEFNRTGLTVTIEYFTRPFTIDEFNKMRQDMLLTFKRRLEVLGISLLAGGDVNIEQPETPIPPANTSII